MKTPQRTLFALLLGAALLIPQTATADLYTYRTKSGELLMTSKKRPDLELVEVVRDNGTSFRAKKSKSRRSKGKVVTYADMKRVGRENLTEKQKKWFDKRGRNLAAAKAMLEKYKSKRKSGMPLKKTHKHNRYDDIIAEASKAYKVPFPFIKAVIKVESSFNPKVISRAGAQGLMQLMPSTAARLKVKQPFDPRQNIFGGTKLLKQLINRYDGDINLVMSAYNAGDRNVARKGGIPFRATRHYVASVYRWYKIFSKESQK